MINNFSTLITDLDASLIYEMNLGSKEKLWKMLRDEVYPSKALPGTVKKIKEFRAKGNKVVITTSRPEFLRNFTIRELRRLGIEYDYILFDMGNGPRSLLNNFQFNSTVPMARSINVDANSGLEKVELEG